MRTEYQRPDVLHRVEPVPEPSPQRERGDIVTSGGSTGGVAATSWVLGYAEKLRDSDTAASLSRTGTQLRAKAAGMWSRTPTPTPENQRSAAYAKHQSERSGGSVDLASGTLQSPSPIVLQERDYTSSSTSSIGSWSEMFSKRGSLPFVGSFIVGESRSGDGQGRPESVGMHSKQSRDSTGSTRLEDVSLYSPPPKPNTFRTQRDSMIGSVLYSAGLSSPETSFPQRSPSSGDLASKSPLQAALAALTGSPTSPGNASSPPISSSGKRGPKPLLLSSSSLITPSSGNRSRSNSRTPSRGPSPSPTPTPRVSSHRFSSASTTTEEEHPVTGASGFVSLRRGPITNPRTAGYSTTAGTASATGSHSSRASTSSTSAYTRSTSLYDPPVVLQSSEEEGRMEHRSRNSGFIVDHGESSTAEYESAVSNPRSEDEEQEEDANEFGARIKQKVKLNRKPASIVVPPLSAGGVPDVQVITPRSGDKMDKGKGPSTVDEKDETFVPPIGTGDARTPGLTRSRTPIRRARGASASSNVDERTPKGQKTCGSARDSMAVSGSEEEGAKADVEDLDDLYGLY
ncbi:hypothetical protein FRC19_000724 [Serendipita sp. 401]|nr:hypothetical protein FRC19_000724 [Serendipita sp. 401]